MTSDGFYGEPRYYDIAFGWDPSREVEFLGQVGAKLARRPVNSVIELGCGTGSMLLALAKQGYAVAGLDLSRPMLDFARAKVAAQKQPVELFLKDMAEFSLFRRFDAAVCFRNTFSYLNPIERAESHLRHVAQHLEAGGIYLIDLTLVQPDGEPAPAVEEWSESHDQVRVDARWELVGPWDPAARTITERLTLRGEERGWQRVWEQEADLRLYSLAELIRLASADGYFTLGAAYQGYDATKQVADAETAAGRTVVVLVRTDKPTPRVEVPDFAGGDQRRGDWGPRGRSGPDRGRGGREGDRRRDGDRFGDRRRPAGGVGSGGDDRRPPVRPVEMASNRAAPQAAAVPNQTAAAAVDPAATKKKRPSRRRRGPRKNAAEGAAGQERP